MHAWHTAHSTQRAQTLIIVYSEPVHAQGTQIVASRVFKEKRMSKKHQHVDKQI